MFLCCEDCSLGVPLVLKYYVSYSYVGNSVYWCSTSRMNHTKFPFLLCGKSCKSLSTPRTALKKKKKPKHLFWWTVKKAKENYDLLRNGHRCQYLGFFSMVPGNLGFIPVTTCLLLILMFTSKKQKYTSKKEKLCTESAFFFSSNQDKDRTGSDDDVL